MKRERYTIFAGLVTVLMLLAPWSALAQANKKPLPKKKNPLFVGQRDINSHQINFYSVEREIALGRQLAAQVEMQVPILRDPVISEYVNRIGQNLALHSDARVPFTIKVLASGEVNAFALPGGFLYVNLGVLKVAETESELAGVMAHEIAHVAARHALENLSKRQLLSLGAIPLIFLGGPVGELARTGANFGLSAAFFKFSRGAEKEADELGAQYLWATGYDPRSLISFFEKLRRRERHIRVSPLFRTHPTTPDRIKNLRKLIARFPEREGSIVNTREFEDIKRRLMAGRGLMPNYAGRGFPPGRRPPVLHRRTSEEPPPPESRGASTSTPPPAVSARRPPVLYRRTSDEPSTADESRPVESTSSPAAGSSTNRRPPKLIRRTSPEAEAGEIPTSTGAQGDRSILLRHPVPGQQRHTRALARTPPRLRRRY